MNRPVNILTKPIELSDFSFDNFDGEEELGVDLKDMFINVVADCEALRKAFLKTNDKRYLKGLIQLLPSSYNRSGYYHYLEEYCDVLEKALDRACELLEDGYGYEYPHEMYNEPFIGYMKVEEWKEWLLKSGKSGQ